MSVNIHQQIAYAEQELSMYRVALPHLVREGKCSTEMAAFRVAAGQAIVDSLRQLQPPGGLTNVKPVICHFATEAERRAFVALVGKKS